MSTFTPAQTLRGRPSPSRTKRRSSAARNNLAGYLFLTPWLIGFFVLIAGPMISSLWLSFTDYSILGTPQWVGTKNYEVMFGQDDRFLHALTVTLTYLLVSVPLVQIFALLLATMVNKGLRGLSIYRSIFYIPSLIGGSVAIAILWRFLFESNGLLNNALEIVGIHSDNSWIGQPGTALSTLIILNVWQFGAAMIIYLAGLRQVPAELHEAATMDGASPIRRYFAITLPMLSPIIFFNVMMNMVGAFQAFNTAYIVSNGTGGPADSTLFYTLYLYQRGFVDFDMGYASALGWILLLMVGIAAALMFIVGKRFVYYGDER